MKKLRYVVGLHCPRNCAGCCNKSIDFSKIPVGVEYYSYYDTILLTGGEPLSDKLYPKTLFLIEQMQEKAPKTSIIVYTAVSEFQKLYYIMGLVDGITLTLHDKSDVDNFSEFIEECYKQNILKVIKPISFRINVFKECTEYLWATMEFSKLLALGIYVKDGIEWIENCPLPEGEELRMAP